jgi:hypothetical protein
MLGESLPQTRPKTKPKHREKELLRVGLCSQRGRGRLPASWAVFSAAAQFDGII